MAKVYVTKYALTNGIEEISRDIHNESSGTGRDFIKYREWIFFYIGIDAFLTKEEAIKKAESMRDSKIESLKIQIDKLEKLKFEL